MGANTLFIVHAGGRAYVFHHNLAILAERSSGNILHSAILAVHTLAIVASANVGLKNAHRIRADNHTTLRTSLTRTYLTADNSIMIALCA
jgi:hypothetical protein